MDCLYFYDAITSRGCFGAIPATFLRHICDLLLISWFPDLTFFICQSEFLYMREKQAELHSCPFSLSFSSDHCLVSFPWFDPALARCPLATSARPAVSEQARRAALPGVEGFCWPDPHAWCDAHKQWHEDSKHLWCHIWVSGAGPEIPPVRELVEITANNSGCWNGVKNRKHSDLHH